MYWLETRGVCVLLKGSTVVHLNSNPSISCQGMPEHFLLCLVLLAEDEPSEDEPSEDEPSEDEPSEDEPSEDEPSEDEPSEDEPSEDEPSEDEPSELSC